MSFEVDGTLKLQISFEQQIHDPVGPEALCKCNVVVVVKLGAFEEWQVIAAVIGNCVECDSHKPDPNCW